ILIILRTLARQSPNLVDEIDLTAPAHFADFLPTSRTQQQQPIDVAKWCWQFRGGVPKSPDLVIVEDARAGLFFLRPLNTDARRATDDIAGDEPGEELAQMA